MGHETSAPPMDAATEAAANGQAYWADIARATIAEHQAAAAAAEERAALAERRQLEAEERAATTLARERQPPRREYVPIELEETVVLSCMSWRQTLDCDPHGPRDPTGDLDCSVVVGHGRSGYCECGGSSRRAH